MSASSQSSAPSAAHGASSNRFTSRFTTRLTLTIMVAAILPTALVGYLCVQTALQSQKNTAREYYFATAERVQDKLMYRVESASNLLSNATTILANRSIDEGSAIEAVRSMLATTDDVSALGIYDTQGNVVEILAKQHKHALPSKLPSAYLSKIRAYSTSQTVVVGSPEVLLDGTPAVLPICAAWKSQTNLRAANPSTPTPIIGFVVVALESEYLCTLAENISSQMFAGAAGRVTILDSTLRVLAHTERKRVERNESLQGKDIFATTSFQSGLSEYVGAVQEYNNANDVPMLGVALFMPLLRMVIVVEEPQSLAYRGLAIMRRNAILWTLGCALLGGLASVMLARQFSKPIQHLAEAASMLARQDFTPHLLEKRSDEFGLLYSTLNHVATELGKYQRLNINQIITERNKLQTVVRQANDGILLLDADQNIVIVNSIFGSWFSINSSNEGTNFTALASNGTALEEVQASVQKLALSPETILPCEFTLKTNTELKERVVRGSLIKIFAESQSATEENSLISELPSLPTAFLFLLRDVTREVETDKLKTELVAIVAHELRSPLNSIYGLAELIGEGILDAEETTEYGRTIAAQSRKLADIINKFLDLSRLESGKTDIRHIPLQLEKIIRTAITTNAPLAAKKSMQIHTNIPDDISPVMGDPDLLVQVMVNLLSNAIKYSLAEKPITVEIRNEKEAIRVLITDEGYGISSSSQEKLFTKFFRASDDKRIKNESGTGLGLAFVKQIIEQHGGEVGVESRLGEGSTFWFRLPV
jgi:signal transduction histidine kinase